jgi:hypothetical protein
MAACYVRGNSDELREDGWTDEGRHGVPTARKRSAQARIEESGP